MGQKSKVERVSSTTPVLVTEWRGCEIRGGVLFLQFMSGADMHTLALGPPTARTGVAIVKEALRSGVIEKLSKYRKRKRFRPEVVQED